METLVGPISNKYYAYLGLQNVSIDRFNLNYLSTYQFVLAFNLSRDDPYIHRDDIQYHEEFSRIEPTDDLTQQANQIQLDERGTTSEIIHHSENAAAARTSIPRNFIHFLLTTTLSHINHFASS